MALGRDSEVLAQIQGLFVRHPELFRELVQPHVLRHVLVSAFRRTTGVGPHVVRTHRFSRVGADRRERLGDPPDCLGGNRRSERRSEPVFLDRPFEARLGPSTEPGASPRRRPCDHDSGVLVKATAYEQVDVSPTPTSHTGAHRTRLLRHSQAPPSAFSLGAVSSAAVSLCDSGASDEGSSTTSAEAWAVRSSCC